MPVLFVLALAPARGSTYTDTFGGSASSFSSSSYYEWATFRVDAAGTLDTFGFAAYSPSSTRSASLAMYVYEGGKWSSAYSRSTTYSSSGYYYLEGDPAVHVDAGDYIAIRGWGADGCKFGYDSAGPVPTLAWGAETSAGKSTSSSPGSALTTSANLGVEVIFTADDVDADGYDTTEDCDDADASAWPGNLEVWYDGVDGDCDGADDFDQDGDGYDSEAYGGDDCDDTEPLAYPWHAEVWYDGIDEDCSGGSDYDQDRDGYDVDVDCDDTNAKFNPGVKDAWYDGVDDDCAGNDDYDQDGDGHDVARFGGDDCDDLDPSTYTGADEVWYDGVDEDCLGGDDDDADGDGHASDQHGGDDCDDGDDAIWKGCGQDTDTSGDDTDGNGDTDVSDTDGTGDGGNGPGDGGKGPGCGCAVTDGAPAPGLPALAALALGLVGVRRRRS